MSAADRSAAPPLGLGGAALGNHRVALTDAAAHELLAEAWAAGVRLFDTAPHYGLGLSERRLGEFLAGVPRAQVRVSSKAGRRLAPAPNPDGALDDEGFLVPADTRRVWDVSPDGLRAGVEESLTRLGLDHLDVVYLHDPERYGLEPSLVAALPVLAELKAEGLVGAVGVGSMQLATLHAALATGCVDELMVANRYTLLEPAPAAGLLAGCADAGVDVVAAAVFHGGLLAQTPTEASSYDYAAVPAPVLARARRLHQICTAAGVPLAAAALQFPLRHRAVRAVVAGAAAPGQIRANVELLATGIGEDVWAELAAAAESVEVRA